MWVFMILVKKLQLVVWNKVMLSVQVINVSFCCTPSLRRITLRRRSCKIRVVCMNV